jgi:hypothetical protein
MAGGIHSLESIPGLHKRLKIRAQATQPDGIGPLESILGLRKRLKIRALEGSQWNGHWCVHRKFKQREPSTQLTDQLIVHAKCNQSDPIRKIVPAYANKG